MWLRQCNLLWACVPKAAVSLQKNVDILSFRLQIPSWQIQTSRHLSGSLEMNKDTLHDNAIDYSPKRLGIYHQAAFDMRHKTLLALQELPEIADVCLGEVAEFDETFVLDCYKGKKFDSTVTRTVRRHGAKAGKRDISNEYICICTGIQHKGEAIAAAINRAKPSVAELISIFDGHIADGTLALCDGLKSYHAFPRIADYTVKKCNNEKTEESCFYHLNTVNGFHSFIKKQYNFYCGVASKYINRYNALFLTTYWNAEAMIKRLTEAVLAVI